MQLTQDIYRASLSLFTDLYQVVMTYAAWKTGTIYKEGVFHLYFRRNPFNGGFTVACGLDYVTDYLKNFHLTTEDIAFLATLKGNNGKALFEPAFFDFLSGFRFSCDVDAIPEGTIVFPNEPLVRVSGPVYQCQWIESPLLNMINFQSLIATKAARLRHAAHQDTILEFGMRRAQGIDGALAASRAAYIGGCDGTSNVLAGKLFGIPVRGTIAHSWVMSFDSELEAFQKYAEAIPNNCVLLVDTYNSIEGVKKAVEVGKWLRENGYGLAGIRLDSGDLAYLSVEARKILDASGFTDTRIVASNDLDENLITSLKMEQDAAIDTWGVGTRLVSSYDQPALGGVYKLGAIRNEAGEWEPKLKLSEQVGKVSNPGVQQVRRFRRNGEYIADMIYDERLGITDPLIIDPTDPTRRKRISKETPFEDLLVPIFRNGACVYQPPSIEQTKAKVEEGLNHLHQGIRRFANPHIYPVGLEKELYEYKTAQILRLRGY